MPSKQNSKNSNEHCDNEIYSNKNNSVIYKNNCFGLTNEHTVKGPPKLNLFRTSQILSEFTELPKSLDGAPLDPLQFNDVNNIEKKLTVLDFDNDKEILNSSRNCPPPSPGNFFNLL